MRGRVVGKHLQRFRQLRSGALVVATEKENGPAVDIRSGEKGVQFQAAIDLSKRFLETAEIGEAETIMRLKVAKTWI